MPSARPTRPADSSAVSSADWDRIAEWAHHHVEELAEEYGGVSLRLGRCPCPIHGGDNPEGFSVKNGKGWHCFTGDCGSGDGVGLVAMLTNRDRVAVLRELAPRAGVFLDTPGLSARSGVKRPAMRPPTPPRVTPAPPPAWVQELDALRADGMTPATGAEMHTLLFAGLTLGPMGRAYLAGRGFDPDTAAQYGFRSVEDASEWERADEILRAHFLPAERASAALDRLPMRYAPALLIPYRGADGRSVVGFTCRAMRQDLAPRYRKPAGATFAVPFNAPALEGLTAADTLHLVEGELNCYTLHTYGMRTVSLGSATFAAGQVERFAARICTAGRLVLWFDDDPAGEKGFQTVRQVLTRHITAAAHPPRVVRQRIRPTHDTDASDLNDLHRTGELAPVLEEAPWQQ